MIPIVIPVSHSPSLCPHCQQPEHRVDMCARCKYVYPEATFTFREKLFCGSLFLGLLIASAGLFIFTLLVLFDWFDGYTLVRSFMDHFHSLIELFQRIW